MVEFIRVKKLREDAIVPERAHRGDAGVDLFAVEGAVIFPGDRMLIPTGISIAIPEGYEGQVRSKSGLALKQGLMVLNSPGTIDAGYRGEIGVIILNTSKQHVRIEKGQKIAQLVITPVELPVFIEVEYLDDDTERGAGGFGSTGLDKKDEQ